MFTSPRGVDLLERTINFLVKIHLGKPRDSIEIPQSNVIIFDVRLSTVKGVRAERKTTAKIVYRKQVIRHGDPIHVNDRFAFAVNEGQ